LAASSKSFSEPPACFSWKGLPQRLLAGQHDLQRRGVVQGGTDQQADVGQGVAVDQMGLVEDHQETAFCLPGLVEDLLEEAFLAAARKLSQLADQQFQQPGGRQVGQVQIDRLPVRPVQFVQEAFQQHRFSHAAGAGHQPDRGLLGQVAEPGQSLLHTIVLPQGRRRDTLGKRLRGELEVVEEHQLLLCFS